jgi:ADP-ribosylglycohydrolase
VGRGVAAATASVLAEQLGNSSAGHESVPTAIFAACAHESFEDAVRFAIRCGGDTDTIGAMAGAIVGAREGASSIPARWLDALEDGARGRRHVVELAREARLRGLVAAGSRLHNPYVIVAFRCAMLADPRWQRNEHSTRSAR